MVMLYSQHPELSHARERHQSSLQGIILISPGGWLHLFLFCSWVFLRIISSHPDTSQSWAKLKAYEPDSVMETRQLYFKLYIIINEPHAFLCNLNPPCCTGDFLTLCLHYNSPAFSLFEIMENGKTRPGFLVFGLKNMRDNNDDVKCRLWFWRNCDSPRVAMWSWKFCPTPGRWWTRGTPTSSKWSAGPTPDRSKSCGEPTTPPDRITSFLHT